MLRITVEIVPGGEEIHRKVLGITHVANVSDLAPISTYEVKMFYPRAWGTGMSSGVTVANHCRRDGWLVLAARVLGALSRYGSLSPDEGPRDDPETLEDDGREVAETYLVVAEDGSPLSVADSLDDAEDQAGKFSESGYGRVAATRAFYRISLP